MELDAKFSTNFTLKELLKGNEDAQLDQLAINRLSDLCVNVLQPLRDYMGDSVTVNSGYRTVAHNNAIGGVKNSDHLYGMAADIETSNNAKAFEYLKTLKFKQLINEQNLAWIHVSYDSNNNWNQILNL